ncbi:Maleylpyruvate isomerase, mycothiol-dependent [Serinicoccus hydrothermalis]|uniref:Maleylpyruvate isomerase, mycothiol-dependent n=1 Tax=Serinicoccus hydrothermalis TaxID=1758689 RepID=A0A1B1NGI3_9MICO|nr:maleylpyruvate isomerase family mycothiol-dependent enzyme [Serinicoccus hydrothermalis]ANS80529.1 Maleylpyruvate isomerase, mycothiol-dependent [Serinicoccus hydrothermalis]
MAPSREVSLTWVTEGTRLWDATLAALEGPALEAPSALPGWSRAHVVAHVALNAEALLNLLTWARTGVETPMYASPESRDADIEELAAADPQDVRARSEQATRELDEGVAALDEEHWEARVRVRQGTEVPASVVPWLRAREVYLHALDLDGAATDEDLPDDFASALVEDAAKQRSRDETHPSLVLREDGVGRWEIGRPGPDATEVVGDVRALAAWVTGRPTTLPVATADGQPLPELPAWL